MIFVGGSVPPLPILSSHPSWGFRDSSPNQVFLEVFDVVGNLLIPARADPNQRRSSPFLAYGKTVADNPACYKLEKIYEINENDVI